MTEYEKLRAIRVLLESRRRRRMPKLRAKEKNSIPKVKAIIKGSDDLFDFVFDWRQAIEWALTWDEYLEEV